MTIAIRLLASIRLDGGTQARAAVDEDTIADYSEAYKRGDSMPPIIVFDDGQWLWLADGFHRVYGAQRAGLTELEFDVRRGPKRDAVLYAAGANAHHGLRRTNADKRRAVEMLLADEPTAALSDRWIADLAHVDHKTVAAVRLGNSPAQVTKDSAIPEAREPSGVDPGRRSLAPEERGDDEAGGAPGHLLGAHRAPPAGESQGGEIPTPSTRLYAVERLIRDAQAQLAPLLIAGDQSAPGILARLNDALDATRRAIAGPGPIKLNAPGQYGVPRDGSPLVKMPRISVQVTNERGDFVAFDADDPGPSDEDAT